MNYSTAELKIKSPDMSWEDCPIYQVVNLPISYLVGIRGAANRRKKAEEYFNSQAQALTKAHNQDVRWNWKGGNNGHYFKGGRS